MNRVVHFEIHAEDPERAAKFSRDVFDCDIKEVLISGVEIKDENRYWVVTTGPHRSPGSMEEYCSDVVHRQMK
jgi:predicted enzyme related to lactoylglutathione lyase